MDSAAKRKDMKQAVKDLRNIYGNEVDSDEGVVEAVDDEDDNNNDDSEDEQDYSDGYGEEDENGYEKPKRRDAFARNDGEVDTDSEGDAHLEQ